MTVTDKLVPKLITHWVFFGKSKAVWNVQDKLCLVAWLQRSVHDDMCIESSWSEVMLLLVGSSAVAPVTIHHLPPCHRTQHRRGQNSLHQPGRLADWPKRSKKYQKDSKSTHFVCQTPLRESTVLTVLSTPQLKR